MSSGTHSYNHLFVFELSSEHLILRRQVSLYIQNIRRSMQPSYDMRGLTDR